MTDRTRDDDEEEEASPASPRSVTLLPEQTLTFDPAGGKPPDFVLADPGAYEIGNAKVGTLYVRVSAASLPPNATLEVGVRPVINVPASDSTSREVIVSGGPLCSVAINASTGASPRVYTARFEPSSPPGSGLAGYLALNGAGPTSKGSITLSVDLILRDC